jgi:WhiB family redox-sensing transcriptional regulator
MSRTSASMTAHAPTVDTDWRADAYCATEAGTKLFFPVGVTGAAEVQIRDAKSVCSQCPVKAECLQFAITTNQEYGVWGGTSEEERRVLRRQWRAERRAARKLAAKAS